MNESLILIFELGVRHYRRKSIAGKTIHSTWLKPVIFLTFRKERQENRDMHCTRLVLSTLFDGYPCSFVGAYTSAQ